MSLTRDAILGKIDIRIRELDVPEWGGSVYIKQLSRGEQDTYLKRQYGDTQLRQDNKAKNQEIKGINIYGHDAYLCVCGICDAEGNSLFTQKDIAEIEKHNGAIIGRIAKEIIEFSDMSQDVNTLDELKN